MKPSKLDLSRVRHYYLDGVVAANNGDTRNPHPPRSLAAFAWDKGNADKRMSPRSIWDAYYDDSGVPRSRNPSRRSVHTPKFDRCVQSVKRSGSPVNPYAVCSSAIGYEGSVKKGHRMRGRNPLPSVRKVYYIICAHKGAENYYLARSGKLTREQSSAARFPTAQMAIDKAKAHLKNYAASRKYRFDLKLAY